MGSGRVYSIPHTVQSRINVFIHFVPFCPSTPSSVISQVPIPTSNWGPAPTKASNQGKVCGPDKSSQTQHREQKKSGKINAISDLSSGRDLWDAGRLGGVSGRDAQRCREYCRRSSGTHPFAEEPGSGTDK